jgi:hypothetical protein
LRIRSQRRAGLHARVAVRDLGRNNAGGRCLPELIKALANLSSAEKADFCYNIVRDGVHVRDLQATLLHQFGIDHERFTYRYQGLDQKLTGVEKATVVKDLLG